MLVHHPAAAQGLVGPSVRGSGSSFHFTLPDGKMEQGSQTHERRESPFAPLRDRRRSERIAR
jgi:hypothetical protein